MTPVEVMPAPDAAGGVLTGVPSDDMQRVLDRLAREDAGMPDPTTLPPEEGREMAHLANRRWNRELPDMQTVHDMAFPRDAGGEIGAQLYVPPGAGAGLILFIHGGGFAFCDIDTHARCARLLAQASALSVLSIDYRLAPEHPYPAGLVDCIEVYRSLGSVHERFTVTRGPLFLAGDSAGANLALTTMLHEQAQGHALPDGALLFYGVYGTDFASPSYTRFAEGPGLTRAKMIRYLDWYVPASKRGDALVAPLLASDEALRALPPLYFNAAEIDPLYSDTERLVARLHGLGRTDRCQVYPGVVHGFMQMSLALPAARQAIEDAARALRDIAGTLTSL